jgi:hypothetical protein
MELSLDLFKENIINLVNDLSDKSYKIIEYRKENGRVNINDLENTVKNYNKEIIPLPETAFDIAQIYKIKGEDRIDIYLPLWTKEEGRSDLTLSLSCFVKNNIKIIEINDLEVL